MKTEKFLKATLLLCFFLIMAAPSFADRLPLIWDTAQTANPVLPSGLAASAFISLFAGILSFISPCTLPILPAYFAFTFQSDRKRIVIMTFAFFLGLASSFTMMGAAASLIGSVFKGYLPILVRICGSLIIALGIFSLLGKGFSGIQFQDQPSATFIGSFIFGLSFSIGWSACVGPILAAILVMAATQDNFLKGMFFLFNYAMGLGLPLILLSSLFKRFDKEGFFWRIIKGKCWNMIISERQFHIHSNNLISGLLFILLGAFMFGDHLSLLNGIIPVQAEMCYFRIEDKLMELLK